MSGITAASSAKERLPDSLQSPTQSLQREQKVEVADTIQSAEEQESCCIWSCFASFFCCICSFFNWLFATKPETPVPVPAAEKKPEPAAATPVLTPEDKARVTAFVEKWYPSDLTEEDMARPINREVFMKRFRELPKIAVLEGRKAVWDAYFDTIKVGLKTNEGKEALQAIDAYIKAHPYDPVLMQRLRSL